MSGVRVPLALEKSAYDPGVVCQYMEESPRETMAAVLEAARKGKINFDEERGKVVGREIIGWYRHHMPGEETDLVTENFYKAVSDLHQDLLDVWSNAVGCFCAACTIGYVPAFPVIRRIQRWSQRRYIDRLLCSD